MQRSTTILGISCFYHDAAAALLVDGKIVAAAEEERFSRKKHDSSFPTQAIEFCLKQAGLNINQIDYVVFYDKPFLKFERIVETYIKNWPKGLISFIKAMREWFKQKLWVEYVLAKKLGFKGKLFFTEHHYAHAASAYYASPFDDALVVTMDGVGEWETTTFGCAKNNQLKLTKAIHFPHSLGLLYSAVTGYLGFKVNSEEYKVMGLAAYGDPEKYYACFKKLINVLEDGSFALNMRYFAYEYGLVMTTKDFDELFEHASRTNKDALEQKHKDIAAALQRVINEIVFKIVQYANSLHPSKNLCLAGGVALNSVTNGKILASGIFENIYVFPASGDAGGAVGAACYLYFDVLKNKKQGSVMQDAFLGPEFSDLEIREALLEAGFNSAFVVKMLSEDNLLKEAARLIAGDHVLGWFQGRMEFGPRALGNRSILADPRNCDNWQRVNLKIKFRESFRPFAPTVLDDYAEELFDLKNKESPFMLFVVPVRNKSIPAVTHVDGSARVQTVKLEQNRIFYNLIKEFYELTGCPAVINTSFNVSEEPIVCTPKQALECFKKTEIDDLVLGHYLISKV